MEGLRVDLNKACDGLSVEEGVRELALKMLDRCFPPAGETLETAQDEELKRLKFACLLYLSKKVRRKDLAGDKPTWGLPEVLEHFQLSIPDFLQELPVLIKECTPTLSMIFGEEIERKLSVREIQTAFVHTLVLGKKARDMFARFLDLPTEVDNQVAPTLRLLWSLFILSKAELLGPLPDLVSSFNLLVCVSNLVLGHLPESLCRVDFEDKAKFPIRTQSGKADTLASIAMLCKTDISEIRPLASSLQEVVESLLAGVVDPDPNYPYPDGQVEVDRPGFPGLLETARVEQALDHLDQRYMETFRRVGELDERGFIQKKEAEAAANKLATPPSMSKCQVRTPLQSTSLQGLPVGTPMRLMPSPLRPTSYMLKTPSPIRMGTVSYFATPGGAPGTPVTESMHLTAWLKETLASCPAKPTSTLKEYFEACDKDITPDIVKRVETLSANIFPSIQGSSGIACMQTSLARERKQEGVKLYYRVLENMLKAEEARTGKRNFTSLLNNEIFHKCLLACAFEMVVASCRMAALTFPTVLERLQLKAFDLCKVIETFVRHEPQLPRELKRHLFNMEEKMLESLVWERGSSLYPPLISACSDAVPAGLRNASLQEAYESKELIRDAMRRGSSLPHQGDAPSDSAKPSTQMAIKLEPGTESNVQTTPTKRSREGSPHDEEVSPPKFHKNNQGGSSPSFPSRTDSTRENTRNTGLTGGLLSPMRGPGQSAFQAFMSPMRPTASVNHPFLGTLPVAFGSPSEYLERPGRAVTADFLRKVLKLGLLRLEDLCDRIDFEPLDKQSILTQVYTMVQHVVYHQTHLLYNRHLDQILLSALYGICKVNHLKQITFKEIIQHYKKQPQAKTDIFRTVNIAQSEPELAVDKTGDIIEFYNSVFIPTVKPFVLQLGQKKATLIQPTTVHPARRALLSPGNLTSPQNGMQTPPAADSNRTPSSAVKVYLSPLRQSPKQPFLTPRSRIFYAGRMGESNSIYQSPSKDLKLINSRIAAHSLQPVAVPSAPQAASTQRRSSEGQSSSDRSCSSGPSAGEGDTSAGEPQAHSQINGHTKHRPGSSQAEQSSGGGNGLSVPAHPGARRGGASGLVDLHDAAMLLGGSGSDKEDSPAMSPSKQARTRRSRRQAGRAPQRVDL